MRFHAPRPPADAQDTAFHDPLDPYPTGRPEDIGPPLPGALVAICFGGVLALLAIALGAFMPELMDLVKEIVR